MNILSQIYQKVMLKTTFRHFKAHYHKTLDVVFIKNLLLTNTISSAVLLLFGDLAQQEIEYQYGIITERYEWERFARMGIIGLVGGPLHHYYYIYLDKLWVGNSLRIVTKKIMADQFVASPLFLGVFFYGMSAMEHKTLKQSNDEVKEKFISVYLVDWLFWPPVQFINFFYLPTQYRVLYVNAATMFYNVFLSYIKHYDGRHRDSS